jgi:lipopolysaccharide/colanic/teichoic acid biosynthesis glycosyltransferase
MSDLSTLPRERQAGGEPWLALDDLRLPVVRLLGKELVDRVGAAVLLVALVPLVVATAAVVAVTSRGPVLYRQRRVGRGGDTFELLKFRTMVTGADARLTGLAAASGRDGLLFKLPDDPRITVVGRFIRRWSLDELPQLWNVLRGEMSLVGPRPLPVRPGDFRGQARRRLRVKPGLTGLWQISGRSDLSWQETLRLDLYYVERWSLAMDLWILLRTPAAVLRGRGAY